MCFILIFGKKAGLCFIVSKYDGIDVSRGIYKPVSRFGHPNSVPEKKF